jgi:heme/copper-type cytochrome/quinol oxidase subunit 1
LSAGRPDKANVRLALSWFVGAALLLLADGAAQIRPPGGEGVDTTYVVIHRDWSIALPAVFALFGALYLGVTPGFPVRLRPLLGWTHLAVMSAGAALTKTPQLALALGALPTGGAATVEAFEAWNRLANIGAALMGLGLLVFVWALVEGLRRKTLKD